MTVSPETAFTFFVLPGLHMAAFCGGPPVTRSAARMVTATAFQESKFLDRIQGRGDRGPARSYFQMEPISVIDVMTRARTKPIIRKVLAECGVDPEFQSIAQYVHDIMAWNDVIAAATARLNYYNDPGAIPETRDAAYRYYDHVWKPGAKRPEDWAASWAFAEQATSMTFARDGGLI